MMPVHVLLLGVVLLATLFLIGGSIQASGDRGRAARRGKPIPCDLLCRFLKALQAAPEEVSIWYDLGVSLSRLSHRKEAAVAFQYVVRHGDPTSKEVRLARRRLANGAPVNRMARLEAPDRSRTVLVPLGGEPGNGTSSEPKDRPVVPPTPGTDVTPTTPKTAWPTSRAAARALPHTTPIFSPDDGTGASDHRTDDEPSLCDESTGAIVVHYVDGRVRKGLSADFGPTQPIFHLLPPSPGFSFAEEAIQVPLKDLKAVFFVRDFVGDRSYNERKEFAKGEQPPGRKIEVTFEDGEVLVGSTIGYDERRAGFFVIPADPRSNNLKVFAVRTAVASVRFL